MSNKNEVFEYLIDQLRQQVNNNQCEDLSHEVQSLKNQLRDASAQIKELHKALATATGDVEAYKLIREQEQSGCRKEDTQGCEHEWRVATFYGARVSPTYCRKCGVAKPEECEHAWYFYDKGASMMCKKCGLKSPCRQKEDTRKCAHSYCYVITDGFAPFGTKICETCGRYL